MLVPVVQRPWRTCQGARTGILSWVVMPRESATTCEVNSCTSRHLFYNIQRTMYILRIKLTMYVILLQWIRWSITIMGCIIVLE